MQKWLNEHPAKTIGFTDCGCGKGFTGGVVLDPFAGSGTVGEAVRKWKPNASVYLIELNPDYIPLIKKRVRWGQKKLGENIEFKSAP